MTPNLYQLTPAISDFKNNIPFFFHKLDEMQLLYQVDFARNLLEPYKIGLITVFESILAGRKSVEKLQCLDENR